jgi:hypothetical protein
MYAAPEEHINRFLNSPQPITVLDYAPNTAAALKNLSFRTTLVYQFLCRQETKKEK